MTVNNDDITLKNLITKDPLKEDTLYGSVLDAALIYLDIGDMDCCYYVLTQIKNAFANSKNGKNEGPSAFVLNYLITNVPFDKKFIGASESFLNEYEETFRASLSLHIQKCAICRKNDGTKCPLTAEFEKKIGVALNTVNCTKLEVRCIFQYIKATKRNIWTEVEITKVYKWLGNCSIDSTAAKIIVYLLRDQGPDKERFHAKIINKLLFSQNSKFKLGLYNKLLPEMGKHATLITFLVTHVIELTTVPMSIEDDSTEDVDRNAYECRLRIALLAISKGFSMNQSSWIEILGEADMIAIMTSNDTKIAILAMEILVGNKPSNFLTQKEFDLIMVGFYIHSVNCKGETADAIVNIIRKLFIVLCNGGQLILKKVECSVEESEKILHFRKAMVELVERLFVWLLKTNNQSVTKIAGEVLQLIYLKDGLIVKNNGVVKDCFFKYVNFVDLINSKVEHNLMHSLYYIEASVKKTVYPILFKYTHNLYFKKKVFETMDRLKVSNSFADIEYIQNLLELYTRVDDFNIFAHTEYVYDLYAEAKQVNLIPSVSEPNIYVHFFLSTTATLISSPRFQMLLASGKDCNKINHAIKYKILPAMFALQIQADWYTHNEAPEGYLPEEVGDAIFRQRKAQKLSVFKERPFARDALAISMRCTKALGTVLFSLIQQDKFELVFEYDFKASMIGYFIYQLMNTKHVGCFKILNTYFNQICRIYSERKLEKDNFTPSIDPIMVNYGNCRSLNLEGNGPEWLNKINKFSIGVSYANAKAVAMNCEILDQYASQLTLKVEIPKNVRNGTRKSAGLPQFISNILMYEKCVNDKYSQLDRLLGRFTKELVDPSTSSLDHFSVLKELFKRNKTADYWEEWLIYCLQQGSHDLFPVRNAIHQVFIVLIQKIFGGNVSDAKGYNVKAECKKDANAFFRQYPKLYLTFVSFFESKRSIDEKSFVFIAMILMHLKPSTVKSEFPIKPFIPKLLAQLMYGRLSYCKEIVYGALMAITGPEEWRDIFGWLLALDFINLPYNAMYNIMMVIIEYLKTPNPLNEHLTLAWQFTQLVIDHAIKDVQSNRTLFAPQLIFTTNFELIKLLTAARNGLKTKVTELHLKTLYQHSNIFLKLKLAEFIAANQRFEHCVVDMPYCMVDYMNELDGKKKSFVIIPPETFATFLTQLPVFEPLAETCLLFFKNKSFPKTCIGALKKYFGNIDLSSNSRQVSDEMFCLIMTIESKIRMHEKARFKFTPQQFERLRTIRKKKCHKLLVLLLETIEMLILESRNNHLFFRQGVQLLFPCLKVEDSMIRNSAAELICEIFQHDTHHMHAESVFSLYLWALPTIMYEYLNHVNDEAVIDEGEGKSKEIVVFKPSNTKYTHLSLEDCRFPVCIGMRLSQYIYQHCHETLYLDGPLKIILDNDNEYFEDEANYIKAFASSLFNNQLYNS
uniref:DUF2428 domain-containing protein n=1 Tax=Rhabditophanes sp. KR3021 TaxID=114890 RepID=A0AC35TG06_9BILA